MTLNSSLAGIRQYKFQKYWNIGAKSRNIPATPEFNSVNSRNTGIIGFESSYIPVSLEFCDADSRNTGIIQGISS